MTTDEFKKNFPVKEDRDNEQCNRCHGRGYLLGFSTKEPVGCIACDGTGNWQGELG